MDGPDSKLFGLSGTASLSPVICGCHRIEKEKLTLYIYIYIYIYIIFENNPAIYM
jgi:hypothetical protein